MTAVTVNSGGSGYRAGTTAVIPHRGAKQQSATPAKLTVTLDSSGAVKGVAIVDGGYYPYYPMDVAEPNSMTIDGRKFDHEISFHKMGLGTAEQWTLDNQSLSYKLSSGNNVGARAADHPFHMHQDPCVARGRRFPARVTCAFRCRQHRSSTPTPRGGVRTVWPAYAETILPCSAPSGGCGGRRLGWRPATARGVAPPPIARWGVSSGGGLLPTRSSPDSSPPAG